MSDYLAPFGIMNSFLITGEYEPQRCLSGAGYFSVGRNGHGLFAAIPAVIAYNRFAARVKA